MVTQGFAGSAAASTVTRCLEGSWAAMEPRNCASCLPPIKGTVSSSDAGAPEAYSFVTEGIPELFTHAFCPSVYGLCFGTVTE